MHVLEYRALRRPWHWLDSRRLTLDHRKLLIVDGATGFIAFWDRFCPTHECITQRYHALLDSRLTTCQNEAMRLSFPIRDLQTAAIDEAVQFILLTTASFVPDRTLRDVASGGCRARRGCARACPVGL
jgi:cardiolipin synthase